MTYTYKTNMSHIQIRISEEEKEYAQQLFRSMGLSMSGAIKLFIRKSIQDDALPFDVSARSIIKKPSSKKEKEPKQPQKQQPKPSANRFSNFVKKEI